MGIITLLYESGITQDKKASFNARRLHGVLLHNKRPIKAIVPIGFSLDFLINLKREMYGPHSELILVKNN